MKTSMIRTFVTFALSAALSPVALMAQSRINATIPFDFTVGTKSFPAGDYSIRRVTESVLMIQNVRDGSGGMTQVSAESTRPDGKLVLMFNRYGDTYFLSKVLGDSQGWRLPASRVEKELIAKAASTKPAVLVAALHSK
ncbi:MAG TPA: hypothetical protein VMT15_16975 [Bryobacteraceae bacterium]|nr:hypothetical protein [Bryobacteraceae bacterium]